MDARYKPTTAQLVRDSEPRAIDDLDVSDKWKERFRLIERAGPFARGKYQNFHQLTTQERRKIGFNVLAFLFSGLYYLCKGMPQKALILFGGGWLFAAVITILEGIFGFQAPNSMFWIAPGAAASSLANRDYYQKMLFGERMWPTLSVFANWIAGLAFAFDSLAVLIAAIMFTTQVR